MLNFYIAVIGGARTVAKGCLAKKLGQAGPINTKVAINVAMDGCIKITEEVSCRFCKKSVSCEQHSNEKVSLEFTNFNF